jgi:hypothetical protein
MQGSAWLGSQTLDYIRQFPDPLPHELFIFVKYPLSECLKYHPVGSLHLPISSWVCHRRIFDLDTSLFTKVKELCAGKVRSYVHDDIVGYPKSDDDFLDALHCLGQSQGYNHLVLYPLCKLVNSDQHMGLLSLGLFERFDHIQLLAREEPGDQNSL